MHEVRDLTQLQQIWRHRGAHSGEHGTGGQCCVPDDRGGQLTREYVQHGCASHDTKFTQHHQGQGDSRMTCREEGCQLMMVEEQEYWLSTKPFPRREIVQSYQRWQPYQGLGSYSLCRLRVIWMKSSASAPSKVKAI